MIYNARNCLAPFRKSKAKQQVNFRAGFVSRNGVGWNYALNIVSKMVDSWCCACWWKYSCAFNCWSWDGNNMDADEHTCSPLNRQPTPNRRPCRRCATKKTELWKLRRRVAEAVKPPVIQLKKILLCQGAELPALIKGVKALGKQYNSA